MINLVNSTFLKGCYYWACGGFRGKVFIWPVLWTRFFVDVYVHFVLIYFNIREGFEPRCVWNVIFIELSYSSPSPHHIIDLFTQCFFHRNPLIFYWFIVELAELLMWENFLFLRLCRFLRTREWIRWDHGWTSSKDLWGTSLGSVASASDPW